MTVSQFQERRFDRQPHFDERSREYPMRAALPVGGVGAHRSSALWKPGVILDQGSEGACVGFGWTQEAVMSPVRVSVADMAQRLWIGGSANSVASAVYHNAQSEDRAMGNNWDGGASVLAGAKAMSNLGYIREYRWCFSIDDVIDTLIYHGPVVLGINWHESMYYPDGFGELQTDGAVVGGHCIVASGYNVGKIMHPSSGRPPRSMVQLTNSWGPVWGQTGQAWIEARKLSELLADGGEACVPIHRSYGRAVKGPTS